MSELILTMRGVCGKVRDDASANRKWIHAAQQPSGVAITVGIENVFLTYAEALRFAQQLAILSKQGGA